MTRRPYVAVIALALLVAVTLLPAFAQEQQKIVLQLTAGGEVSADTFDGPIPTVCWLPHGCCQILCLFAAYRHRITTHSDLMCHPLS